MKKKLKERLQKYPTVSKLITRSYLYVNYILSDRKKSEGDIERISPMDGYEYFFGYYDKSPWNIDERYVVCLRIRDSLESVAPSTPAEIVLIDMLDDKKVEVINQTHTWNLQQGAMLQWLGPNFDEEIIFNDFRDGKYCSIIYNIHSKKERILSLPVYDVTRDGKYALSLDFSRLHSLRPGYGYSNLIEINMGVDIPDDAAIQLLDIKKNTSKVIVTYRELFDYKIKKSMIGAKHGVNHIMINPSGNRTMFLHRWIKDGKTYTRLLTMNIDGSDLFILNDDDMTSHSYWKNDTEILSFAHKDGYGKGYFNFYDKSQRFDTTIEELKNDGHPSYSPDGKKIITDQYTNKQRKQMLYLVTDETVNTLAKVFSPFKFDGDFRCDLHPKWDRKSNKVAFDGTFEGKRELYMVRIGGNHDNEKD